MNRLAHETSPYLRQHADNPVEWWPWCDEAFAEAARRDVPVLLSIGYSACHWCHVMAHESFEDPEVAALMNDRFVNIKVDREERPDVDAIYMEAVQALTEHGGWPLTVFLAPDGRPFFGGTYFPTEPRQGLPGFSQLLEAISRMWTDGEERAQLEDQASRLTASLGRMAQLHPGAVPGPELVEAAVATLVEHHDAEWGGFGQAPKFPMAMSLELLLRHHARTGAAESLAAVTTTLEAMASGGIRDHLGGGYARYSVDAFWMVPHFEKMLYDQALIGRVLLHAWQLTGDPRWRQELDELIGYVLRDLRHPDGGFYSAEDADSEGEEGRFYVWRPEELRAVLGDDLAARAMEWWGATEAGNFEGANILHRPVRGDLMRPDDIEAARVALFEARRSRVRPGLDDKVLTEWNALFIALLAEAAAATGTDAWADAAVAGAEFLLAELRHRDGTWHRSWQADGGARHRAYAGDLAALIDSFVRLHELTGQARWVDEAVAAADRLLADHADAHNGGFFTTAHDAEALVTRPKDLLDNAIPSANGAAAFALARLAALTGDDRHHRATDEVLGLIGGPAARHPEAFAHGLCALDVAAHRTEICIAGHRPDLVDVVRSRYRPAAVATWGERFDSPVWADRPDGAAYVCEGFTCRAPARTPDELVAALGD